MVRRPLPDAPALVRHWVAGICDTRQPGFCGGMVLGRSRESDLTSRPAIKLKGAFNLSTAPHIRRMLLRAASRGQVRTMHVDFSAVSHVDTSCVAILVELIRILKARRAVLRLTGVELNAARIFSLAGLDTIFEGMIHLK